jgi:hypothetical protein
MVGVMAVDPDATGEAVGAMAVQLNSADVPATLGRKTGAWYCAKWVRAATIRAATGASCIDMLMAALTMAPSMSCEAEISSRSHHHNMQMVHHLFHSEHIRPPRCYM